MEKRGYLKNGLNKFLWSLIIIGGLLFIFLYLCSIRRHHREEMIIPKLVGTTAPRLISVNIKWQDSAYCTVLEDDLLFILEEEGKTIISYPKLSYEDFINLSYKDTLLVDSLSFIHLKDYMVIPQYRIDSIYNSKGVEGLLSAYFDEGWFIPYCQEGLLTLPEERYVINVLQRHGYSMAIDCESGCLHIVDP